MKRLLPILLASLLPMAAHAECAQKDLQGRWVLMVGFEVGDGVWSRCSLRITSTGRSTGSCLRPNGSVVPGEPGQFLVNRNCSVSSQSQDGTTTTSGRIQAGKRGVIGRAFYDDGEISFGGPYVAVKR